MYVYPINYISNAYLNVVMKIKHGEDGLFLEVFFKSTEAQHCNEGKFTRFVFGKLYIHRVQISLKIFSHQNLTSRLEKSRPKRENLSKIFHLLPIHLINSSNLTV